MAIACAFFVTLLMAFVIMAEVSLSPGLTRGMDMDSLLLDPSQRNLTRLLTHKKQRYVNLYMVEQVLPELKK